MKFLTVAIAMLFLSPAAAGELYKWVDKDGNVHYSDTPVAGAERLELEEPATFDAVPTPPRRMPPRTEEPQFQYGAVDFISPKQDQVFWAVGGDVPVYLNLEPPLLPGHRIQLYFDGELTEDSPLSGPGTTLTGVFRGAHTVRAVVVDEGGDEMASAGPITFHVKQRAIPNPQTGQNRTTPRRRAAGD